MMLFITLCFIIPYLINGRLETLTGVPFEMMGFYSLGDKFECLDKSKVIKFSAVNDDYCDCRDGSDEPGTSACNNGRFYCKNEGHVGKFIPSIWVNDGYCDCCDGSDEYSTYAAKCNDTCMAQANVHKEKIHKIHNNYLKGHEIYKSYQLTINDLVNKRLEELNRERENTIQQRTEQAQQDFENKKKLAEEKLAKKEKKLAEMAEAGKNVEQAPPPPAAQQAPVNEFDPAAEADKIIAQESAAAETPELEKEEPKEDQQVNEDPNTQPEEDIDVNEEIVIPTEPDPITPVPEVQLPDYGPNNIFVHLTEMDCLTLDQNEYTYKLCPFKGAYQLPRGSTHSETNLGRWSKWINTDGSDPINKPIEMLYDHGTACWNGPSRSTNVVIHCGEVDKILSAEEPSRCQYKFVMTSPTACSKTAEEMLELVKASNFEGIVLHDEL